MLVKVSLTFTTKSVVTNRRKTLHRDKMVANFLMGTRRLYDFVDDNPAMNMFPVDYGNKPVHHRPERQRGGHQLGHSG